MDHLSYGWFRSENSGASHKISLQAWWVNCALALNLCMCCQVYVLLHMKPLQAERDICILLSYFVPSRSCQRKTSLCIKAKSSFAKAAGKNLVQHHQDSSLSALLSALFQHKASLPSSRELVCKNNRRERVRFCGGRAPGRSEVP